jgi:predicted ATPase
LQGLELLRELPHTWERDHNELGFRIALGPLLMNLKGFASREVGENYTPACALGHDLGEHSSLIWATRGLSTHHLVCGRPGVAHEMAEELLSLVDKQPEISLDPSAHFALASALFQSLYYLGELTSAHEHCRRALATYSPEQRSLFRLHGGPPDLRVNCCCYGAWAAWALGYPDKSIGACRTAIDLARETSHPPSLALALVFTARLHQFRRDPQQTQQHAEAAMTVAREQGFPQRLAAATILFGWARAVQGLPDGIETMAEGLADYRSTGAGDDVPYWLALLAGRRAAARQFEAASADLDKALALVTAGGPRVWEAELHRLKGVLLTRRANGGEPDAAFEAALAIARRQQAKAFELRAATSLARWRRHHGRHLEALRFWSRCGRGSPRALTHQT